MTSAIDQGRAVLEAFGFPAAADLQPLGSGLINDTFALAEDGQEQVPGDASGWVLQRVHTVFSPLIHHNIAAVTEHLAARNVATPRLRPTVDGALWHEHQGRVWRVMSRLPGVTFDAVVHPGQAYAAAATLGLFHRTLEDLQHTFVGLRTGVHDTNAHVRRLREALELHREHRLYDRVAPLAASLLRAAESLPALEHIAPRVAHGDPKLNNVVFAGRAGASAQQPVGLIDLDTVAPMGLHLELGDAWRSWCNPKGEDETEARFDMEVFRASVEGYRSQGPTLAADELDALVYGVEIISLELAARFLADALHESYFGWNRERFASAGEHNLVRAQGQWSLHRACVDNRSARASLLRA